MFLRGALLDLHQGTLWKSWAGQGMLRGAPRIEDRYLVNTRHRAMRGAGFFAEILAPQVFARVVFQRNRRIAPLLRAVVHQAVFSDVEIPRSGAASPVVRLARRNVVLKRIHPREASFFQALHLVIDSALFIRQRLQLPAPVVNDPDSGAEAQLDGTLADHQRILRVLDARADD